MSYKFEKHENTSLKTAHKDYSANLFKARAFIKNVEKSLESGMRTYISGSHEIVDCLLMITFTPPRYAPLGNYATPIFLHQASSEYSKQVEAVFNSYIKFAKEFWSTYNKKIQGDLFDGV